MKCPNVEVTGLRGFLRSSGGLPGWAHVRPKAPDAMPQQVPTLVIRRKDGGRWGCDREPKAFGSQKRHREPRNEVEAVGLKGRDVSEPLRQSHPRNKS